MYPNLYYVFKDWFGVEWKGLSLLNTFGLMVAMGFVTAAIVLSKELQRKEKEGLLSPREEMITVGKPATVSELIINAIVGFIFGYKIFGIFFSMPAGLCGELGSSFFGERRLCVRDARSASERRIGHSRDTEGSDLAPPGIDEVAHRLQREDRV